MKPLLSGGRAEPAHLLSRSPAVMMKPRP